MAVLFGRQDDALQEDSLIDQTLISINEHVIRNVKRYDQAARNLSKDISKLKEPGQSEQLKKVLDMISNAGKVISESKLEPLFDEYKKLLSKKASPEFRILSIKILHAANVISEHIESLQNATIPSNTATLKKICDKLEQAEKDQKTAVNTAIEVMPVTVLGTKPDEIKKFVDAQNKAIASLEALINVSENGGIINELHAFKEIRKIQSEAVSLSSKTVSPETLQELQEVSLKLKTSLGNIRNAAHDASEYLEQQATLNSHKALLKQIVKLFDLTAGLEKCIDEKTETGKILKSQDVILKDIGLFLKGVYKKESDETIRVSKCIEEIAKQTADSMPDKTTLAYYKKLCGETINLSIKIETDSQKARAVLSKINESPIFSYSGFINTQYNGVRKTINRVSASMNHVDTVVAKYKGVDKLNEDASKELSAATTMAHLQIGILKGQVYSLKFTLDPIKDTYNQGTFMQTIQWHLIEDFFPLFEKSKGTPKEESTAEILFNKTGKIAAAKNAKDRESLLKSANKSLNPIVKSAIGIEAKLDAIEVLNSTYSLLKQIEIVVGITCK